MQKRGCFPRPLAAMPKILLLKVGHTFEHVARVRGDYDAWFAAHLGGPEAVQVVHVAEGEPLPRSLDYAGVVVTGSFAMVTERAAWSEATADYLRAAVDRALPTLGVCYGHQLLADALGGEVGDNPRGRQAGTVSLELTLEAWRDPLFGGLPPSFRVHVSHRQSVLSLPEGATLLARCPGDPHHAYRLGETAWGVQFHPEFNAEVSRAYIEARREILRKEGLDPDALLAAVEESEHGARVLARFVELLG
jgi:GMP synthase (glutamine-hydrolysing)